MRPQVIAFMVAGMLTGGLVWVAASLGPEPPPRWSVTRRVSAHRALVMDVQTSHPEDAVAIARQVCSPESARFDEILVFFHDPATHSLLRRVQWTPRHGFVEDVY
jgi:hypothetical protein